MSETLGGIFAILIFCLLSLILYALQGTLDLRPSRYWLATLRRIQSFLNALIASINLAWFSVYRFSPILTTYFYAEGPMI